MRLNINYITFAYLVAYMLAGFYSAWIPMELVLASSKNLLFYSFFLLPLVVACIGMLIHMRGKSAILFLWVCSIFWFVISAAEVFEVNKIIPNTIFIVLMLVISISCLVYLSVRKNYVNQQIKRKDSREQNT